MTTEIFIRPVDDADNFQIENFSSFNAILRRRDVGSWSIELPVNDVSRALATPGAGIVVERNGQILISGPMQIRERSSVDDVKTYIISGVSDACVLWDRIVWPGAPMSNAVYAAESVRAAELAVESAAAAAVAAADAAAFPDNLPKAQYASGMAATAERAAAYAANVRPHRDLVAGSLIFVDDAYDIRTGIAETVMMAYVEANCGNGPWARPTAGLSIGADLGRGYDVIGRGRFQTVGEILQELAMAGGGLGFSVDDMVFSTQDQRTWKGERARITESSLSRPGGRATAVRPSRSPRRRSASSPLYL